MARRNVPDGSPPTLAIDLQALQTDGSRTRGIGRYAGSLIEGLLTRAEKGGVSYRLYANGLLTPPELDAHGFPVVTLPYQAHAGAAVSEAVYATALLADGVDGVVLPSPMEMWDAVMPDFARVPIRLYSVCHDLIPLLFAEKDLGSAPSIALYRRRLANMSLADAVFTNSEATRRDVIAHLGVAPDRAHTILAGVSPYFRPLHATEKTEWRAALNAKFGVSGRFLLYTGGENWRKNIDGLIRAYGLVPAALRDQFQLVVACSLSPRVVEEFTALASRCGVRKRLVLTNYVSDDEMRALYGLCDLFVFPSLYEGFGLPIAEAMACGAPAIAANNSSLPEVVDGPDALFDGASPDDTARKIAEMLSDDARLATLAQSAPAHAAQFAWSTVAERMGTTLARELRSGPVRTPPRNVALYRLRDEDAASKAGEVERPLRVAFFSPLPPQASGISDYSAELLPYLARYAALDIVTDAGATPPELPPLANGAPLRAVSRPRFEEGLTRARRNAAPCDLPVYQMGNSRYHAHAYAFLQRYAGVTVLHDYSLNGLLSYIASQMPDLGVSPLAELEHAYGPEQARVLLPELTGHYETVEKLPAKGVFTNRRIFTRSLGVIVHSRWAHDKAVAEFGADCPLIAHIPHLMPVPADLPNEAARADVRDRLNVRPDAFVVVAAGFVHANKRAVPILDAFRRFIQQNPNPYLVFSGSSELFGGDFAGEITRRGLTETVRVTGFVDMATFYDYITIADVCLSLRYPSNGETSGALLRILSRGKATIVTDIGSFSDYGPDIVHKIAPPHPDGKNDEAGEILHALTALADNPEYRARLGDAAARHIQIENDPDRCARLYANFLREVHAHPHTRRKLLADYAGREAAQALRRTPDAAHLTPTDLAGLLTPFRTVLG